MPSIVQLYREARRRKVFRTAALYVLGSWAVLQVADVLFPGFGIPETAIRALVWTAALGFPVALIFGWLFDIGPGGIRRTPPPSAAETAETRPLGRHDYALLAAFVVIAAVLVFRAVQEVREAPVAAAPGAAAPGLAASGGEKDTRLPNSIAVLPFTNISSDPDNEYFCDGISEEILNEISTVHELNVIGRTSSFAFKDSNIGIEKISATLGVHYVLQGSVRKAGNQLRISAQLLDERGRQLWAQTFDRELTNVFEIQEEIAQAVVSRIARQVDSSPKAPSNPSLEAYDRYLAGRDLLHKRDTTEAMTELQHAIDLDPGFAEAQAEWAIARLIGSPSKQDLDAAAAAIDHALELKPQLLRAQAARGLWFLQSTPSDAAAAKSVLQGVLDQDPNMSDALLWLSIALDQSGQHEESVANLNRAARIDPLHPSIVGNLASALIQKGDDEAALRLLNRQLQQPNPGYPIYLTLRHFYRMRGRLVELNVIGKDVSLRGVDTHYSLAASYALLGNFDAADEWMARNPRDFPKWPMWPYAVSVAPNWRGDIEQSRQRFEQGVESAGLSIEKLSPVFRIWYGALLARSGHHADAIKILEPAMPLIPTTGQISDDELPDTDGPHALAWSYLRTGEKAKADRILTDLLEKCRSDVDDRQPQVASNVLHRCAETALLAGDAERALALLERAVKAGWRDYYVRRNDPYWAALENDPRYRALMATVKADVDRQRAVVERINATDRFKAKLDAAMAARREARQQPGEPAT